MSKDTFYFSHDYNARTDEKLKMLIRRHGMEGYGIFWAIVEDLYNNANALRMDCDGIAYDLRTDSETIKSIINDFDLFQVENGIFGSLSIQRRIDERDEKSENARRSANYRWSKNNSDANALRTECDRNAIKERKGKENKEKEIKEDVIVGDKSPTVHHRIISSYDSFLKSKTGTPAKINGADGKAVKEIATYLTRSCKQHNENATDDTIVEAWQLILDRYSQWEPFHQSQLRLTQINQNLINIINTIKNGKPGKYSAGNDLSSIDRIGAAVFAQYVSGPTTSNTGTDN